MMTFAASTVAAWSGSTGAEQNTALSFSPPRLVADPHNATGPWWTGVHRLSDMHMLGQAGARMLATADGGQSWFTQEDAAGKSWLNDTDAFGGIFSADGTRFHNAGDENKYSWISPTGSNRNVTAVRANSTDTFSLSADGTRFVRSHSRPFSIEGLPHVSGFRVGSAASTVWLKDGSMLATSVTTGVGSAARRGYLSVIALRSVDAGFSWYYIGVVAAADEVPYAHEGPSENALAFLNNGSLLCVMRVEGESGHHSPYVSKTSDDGGYTWRNLRSLAKTWPGEQDGAGCVRPRLARLNGSLVLAGGRPNPISRDELVWLNAAGDGELWRPYSLSYWHNRLITNQSWAMPERDVNDSRRLPRYDTSYTSLVPTGPVSAFVLYGAGLYAFAIHFALAPE